MMRGKGIGAILVGISVFWGTSVWAQTTERGVIESPSAFVSGIGFISGWKCNAENITLKIWCNNLALPHKPVSMDVPRPDTQAVCDGSDTNNGWIAQVNWNDYQNCTRVEAFDDGHMFASRDFTVGTISDEFIRDHDGTSIRVADFPVMGQVSRFVWSTATQHWEAMYSFPCREEDNCDDQTTDGGNTPGGDNTLGPPPHPEMIVADGAYAGDQDLVQYKGMLALPPPTYQEALVRGDTVTWYSSFSYSLIFEPDAWKATGERGGAEIRIPKEDLPGRIGEIKTIYTRAPVLSEIIGAVVFNLTGVGGGVRAFDMEDETVETFLNRPDLADRGEWDEIHIFVNKDTAEIGYIPMPPDLDEALGGWLDAMFPNAKCDGRDWGEENRIQCREKIKAIDSWWAEVTYPNQGRGPWRYVQRWRWAQRSGRIFSDMQSSVRFSRDRLSPQRPPVLPPYVQDLAGTGKLEVVYMSGPQWNVWQRQESLDDLSQFITPAFEFGSVVD